MKEVSVVLYRFSQPTLASKIKAWLGRIALTRMWSLPRALVDLAQQQLLTRLSATNGNQSDPAEERVPCWFSACLALWNDSGMGACESQYRLCRTVCFVRITSGKSTQKAFMFSP